MFVAVTPPGDVVQHLDAYLEPRREPAGPRWSPPEQLHATLAFYAAVPDLALDELTDRLAYAASRRTSFTTRVAGGGAFPDPVQARVLYARLELSADAGTELDRLAAGARAAAGRAGVSVDGQRFRPHVTVARLAHPVEATRWLRVLDAYRGPEWTVDHVSLVASYLGEGPRGRPRYETVAELPLA
jgi:2'-5' RNA ligase